MTSPDDDVTFYVGKHWRAWAVYSILDRGTHSTWPTREQAQAACDKANANAAKRARR